MKTTIMNNKPHCTLYLVFFVLFITQVHSQDTVRVMYYNLLNFPDVTPSRCDTLRKILQHAKPDIFVVNELQSLYGANLILNQSLNVFGTTHYQKANFINGSDTDNMFYYNTNLFGFISQQQLATPLRDISEYVVYYKPSAGNGDTIFLRFYSMHLKASTGQANEQQRQQEVAVLKNYLQQNNLNKNIIAGGDLNLYASTEPAYITLTAGGTPLYDPLNSPGAWSGDAQFASLHTQSVRINSYLGGAGGGMDDRFDHILVSGDVLTGLNKVKYVQNTYWAYGQDGNRFNAELIIPQNNSLPDSVLKAMYNMSDHLPVFMKIYIDPLMSQVQKNNPHQHNIILYPNPTNQKVLIQSLSKILPKEIYITNLVGSKVFPLIEIDENERIKLDFSQLPSGIYYLYHKNLVSKIIVEE